MNQKCKTPWLRFQLFRRLMILNFNVNLNRKVKISLVLGFNIKYQLQLPRLLYGPDCFAVSTLCTYLAIATYLPRLLHGPDYFRVSILCPPCVRPCVLLFGATHWSMQPRVFRCSTSILLYLVFPRAITVPCICFLPKCTKATSPLAKLTYTHSHYIL